MKRAYQADAVQVKADYSTLKSDGWPTNGDPLNSQPPTQPGAAWHQMVTEEIVSVIEAAELTPDNEPQLKTAIDTLMDREIENAKAVFVTVDGEGTQTVNQSKTFAAVNYGKKLEQSADLSADSTAVPVWSNVYEYAPGLNRANVMLQDNTFNAGVTVKGALNAAGGINGNLTGNVEGNADTATALKTARTIRTNLASTSTASFNGTANITPGVTGILGTANGGTGRTDGLAQSVVKKFSLSARGDIGYGSNNDYLPDRAAIAYWNGAYSDTVSNLTYCANGTIVGTTGNQTIGGNKTFSGTTTLNGNTVTKAIDCNGNQDVSGTLAVHGKFTGSGGGALTGNWTCPTPDASTEIANKSYVDAQVKSGGSVPAGAIIPYMGQGSVPSGYLLCNGAKVSRTTYAALFTAIGTKFGTGDGSTTFTLPNLNSRYLQGTTGKPGTAIAAGLPNITGEILVCHAWGINVTAGALYYSDSCTSTQGADKNGKKLNLSASRSNSAYGGASTVQPAAYTVQYLIKY